MTDFFRVLDASVEEKPLALREAIDEVRTAISPGKGHRRAFERLLTEFADVPGSPFAYWLTPHLFELFRTLQRFDNGTRVTRVGLGTLDDYQFLRLWLECAPSTIGSGWVPLANGGPFSRYFSDIPQVVMWHQSGRCLKAYVEAKVGSASRKIQSEAFYFRVGITWPLRAKAFCPQILPSGCAFSARGYAAFAPREELLSLAALGSSVIFDALYKIMLGRFGFPEFLVGILGQVPVPDWTREQQENLAWLARRAWSLRRMLDGTNETSHAFVLPPGFYENVTGLHRLQIEQELGQIQTEVDACAFDLYKIGAEERETIESSLKGAAPPESLDGEPNEDASEEDDMLVGAPADTQLSWFVGVALGRFDKRLATGERAIPSEPGPFDPLPSRSPGMWPEGEPRAVLPPDILVDDPGHERDLVAHVTQASIGTGVDVPHDLRQWVAREFFPLHIKMYSKSRRKAPIYWQLATSSASYSVWLYLHAFTKDTLYKVQNEYVAPKLMYEERKLESLRRELGESAKAAERKALAAQESFVEELRAFLDEVKRVAPLWNPDLDDGVIINFAPLWRLVPHHKPWQKELKATWDALCAGKYDWAHLAMHLWPERVVPKCATDRSLAIAHDLEEEFWVGSADNKWRPRITPLRPIDELVQERASPAVKAALQSLLDAPVAQTRKTSTRSKRAR